MKRTVQRAANPGARLWSQTQPQPARLFTSAAAGASHTAAPRSSIPAGLCLSAQGWPRQRTTLGQPARRISNPNGVVAVGRADLQQPLQGCIGLVRPPRVARSAQPWALGRNPFGIRRRVARIAALFAVASFLVTPAHAESVSIVIASNAAPRVQFGAQKLAEALKAVKLDAAVVCSAPVKGRQIIVTSQTDSITGREGFILETAGNGNVLVIHADASGALYGCLELARRIRE